jgi:hypothetical protein
MMTVCLVQTSIVKPQTSRPANSERFLVCLGLKQRSPSVATYLLEVNAQFVDKAQRGAPEVVSSCGRASMRWLPCSFPISKRQIVRLVSPDAMPSEWTHYVRRSNIHIGEVCRLLELS